MTSGDDPHGIEAFRTWLLEMGRSEGTARLYGINVKSCLEAPGGITSRLVRQDLAPKTRHVNKAALMAWAEYTEDEKLRKRLAKIKLPPSVRVTPKEHLEIEHWRKVTAAASDVIKDPAVRATCLIICLRGLRCSDVLRLTRPDVMAALRSTHLSGTTKGGKRIEWLVAPIRAPLEVLAAQPEWQSVVDLVVPTSKHGDGYHRRQTAVRKLERAMERVAKKAEVDNVYPHRMRTTYASHFVRGMPNDPLALIKLQQHMNWANISTAAGYVDAVRRDELDAHGAGMTADFLPEPPPPPAKPRRPKR